MVFNIINAINSTLFKKQLDVNIVKSKLTLNRKIFLKTRVHSLTKTGLNFSKFFSFSKRKLL